MYKKLPVKRSKKPYLLSGALLIVLLAGSLFALEKLHVTNFYSRNTSTPETSQAEPVSTNFKTGPTNAIDYNPAKPEDTSTTSDKTPAQDTAPINAELGATITSTRNSTNGTAYLIKVAVTGTDTGVCKATMTKGSSIVSANSDISLSAGQYSCTNLSIPISVLNQQGTWKLDVTVTDKAGATFSTSAEVTL